VFLLMALLRRRWRREPLNAAVETAVSHFYGHEKQIAVHRDVALSTGANERGEQRGLRGVGDVKDVDPIEIALEEMGALEREVGVGEGELRNDEAHRLLHLCLGR